MRTELTILEEIDAYLGGKLTASEKSIFEGKLESEPQLQELLSKQKELIQAVKRKALRAQISAVSAASGGGSGSGLSNLFMALGGFVLIVGLIAGIVYLNKEDEGTTSIGELAQNDATLDYDQMGTEDVYEDDAHEMNIEEPETVFSSIKQYEQEEESDRMSVNVNFQPSQDRVRIYPNTKDGKIVEEEGQSKVVKTNKNNVEYNDRAQRAEYPGGKLSMKRFIDKNLRYPISARNKGTEAVIRCEFIVTADGLIQEINSDCIKMSDRDGEAYSDLKVLLNKRIMDSFIGNATHILRTMPTWEPAKNSVGTPVLSMQRIYFDYSLDKGCLVYQLDDDITIEEDSQRDAE
ncbi:hypothetical protein N8987_01080 [Crocinitomix sp.]|nr:hypothetical protein [Crocinitomix sp.]